MLFPGEDHRSWSQLISGTCSSLVGLRPRGLLSIHFGVFVSAVYAQLSSGQSRWWDVTGIASDVTRNLDKTTSHDPPERKLLGFPTVPEHGLVSNCASRFSPSQELSRYCTGVLSFNTAPTLNAENRSTWKPAQIQSPSKHLLIQWNRSKMRFEPLLNVEFYLRWQARHHSIWPYAGLWCHAGESCHSRHQRWFYKCSLPGCLPLRLNRFPVTVCTFHAESLQWGVPRVGVKSPVLIFNHGLKEKKISFPFNGFSLFNYKQDWYVLFSHLLGFFVF